MTQAYIVASARRLRELRQLAEAPTLRQRMHVHARQQRRQMWQDLALAVAVLAAGWLVGMVVS